MSFANLADVLAEVEELGRRFTAAGHELYLVGGIVRDQLLDAPVDASSDIDLTTSARPDEIKTIVTPLAQDMWMQGERFGTIGLRFDGRDYEITTFRAESYSSDSRKPEVSFGDDIEVDLSRRDFTVNAMAIELPAGTLVDPFRGADDLTAGLLRTPLSADVSFSDDPLRMLRAARFATKFALRPVDDVITSATALHERLRIVAIERIGVEVRRLLELADPTIGLRFLQQTGLLAEVICFGHPEMTTEVVSDLDRGINMAAELTPDWRLRLAGLACGIFGAPAGVDAAIERLRLSRDDQRHISGLASAAFAVLEADDISAPTLRRWVHSTAEPADSLVLAQVVSAPSEQSAQFATALAALREHEDLDAVTFLSGDQIMEALNVPTGREVGQALRHLKQMYLDHGPSSETDQLTMLAEWSANR